MLVLGNRELVDDEPVIVLRLVKIYNLRLCPGNCSVRPAVFDRHPVSHQSVQGSITRLQRRSLGPHDPAIRIFHGLGRQRWIQPLQGLARSVRQGHLPIVSPFGPALTWNDLGAVLDHVTEVFKPREGRVFDDGLGKEAHGGCTCETPKLLKIKFSIYNPNYS